MPLTMNEMTGNEPLYSRSFVTVWDFTVTDTVEDSMAPNYADAVTGLMRPFDIIRITCSNGMWVGVILHSPTGAITIQDLMVFVEPSPIPVPVVDVPGGISAPNGFVVGQSVAFSAPVWSGVIASMAGWITRDGVQEEAISGESVTNYLIVASDEGKVLGARYIASNESGDSIPEVYSSAVEVEPAPPPPVFPQTFWEGTAANPGKADPGDAETYTLGWVFSVTEAATLRKLLWRKPAGEGRSSRTFGLFNASGTLIATASTSNEPASGWIEVEISGGVALTANTDYKAAVLVTNGYSIGPSFNPDVTHERIVGKNGFYRANTTFGNPTSGTGQTNYYLDVEVEFATEYEGEEPPPPPTGWPDATNTGVPAGTTLTPYTGPMTITTPGTIIDSKTINGTLTIAAANVIIRKCRLTYSGTWGIDGDSNNATNLTVEDCDLIGPGTSGQSNAPILARGNFLRNDISQAENGIVLKDGPSIVKGNYIHDLNSGRAQPHFDGISVQGGQNGVLIEDNTISARDTSDVFIKNDFGNIQNVKVNHNLLIGDPGFALYVDNRGTSGQIGSGIEITNNHVKRGFWGYFSIENHSPLISGNVDYLTGAPVNG